MRKAIACCAVIALLGIFSGIALLNCPFLQEASTSGKSCCPRETTHCPLSKSLDACPYFITEAKIGQAEEKSFGLEAASTALVSQALPVLRRQEIPQSWSPAQTDLHLRIRLLRI